MVLIDIQVNNVIVAAAHGEITILTLSVQPRAKYRHIPAHLIHGIKKVVVFDIDLHHGMAWKTSSRLTVTY